jgi:hypothetical protein
MASSSISSDTTAAAKGELDGESSQHPNGLTRAFTNLRKSLSRTGANHDEPQKATFDPNLDPNLPYRTLSGTANLDEYRVEAPSGEIPAVPPQHNGNAPGAAETQYKLVTFKPEDPENPKNWSKAYKWYCTMVVAITCFVVAFCSSVITADIAGVSKEFHVSEEVALLTISLFVVGFGVGPMVFAPLSEIYGRRII